MHAHTHICTYIIDNVRHMYIHICNTHICAHMYTYISIYTHYFLSLFLFFMWDKIKLGKIILGEMKKNLKLIQKHGRMPQTYVKVGWAHAWGGQRDLKKKRKESKIDDILALLCLHLYFQKHDAKGDIR